LLDFFEDKEDKTKVDCSLANEYSPFHGFCSNWEALTKMVTGENHYGNIIH
jgi:hypothetical protein